MLTTALKATTYIEVVGTAYFRLTRALSACGVCSFEPHHEAIVDVRKVCCSI